MESRLRFSVSATSRIKRPGETDGKDYYFISQSEFIQRTRSGEFVEWEEVYEEAYYGTLKSEVDRIGKEGKAVIFDVDVKGGISLKNFFRDQAISIFVKVRDLTTLENRLRKRNTESGEALKARLEKSIYEMTFSDQFDYLIFNDDLENSCADAYQKVRNFLDQ